MICFCYSQLKKTQSKIKGGKEKVLLLLFDNNELVLLEDIQPKYIQSIANGAHTHTHTQTNQQLFIHISFKD